MSYTKNWIESNDFHTDWRGPTTIASPGSVVFTNTRTGTKLEDWKGRIRRGEQAATPYYLDATTVVSKRAGSADLAATIPRPPELPSAGTQAQVFKGFVSRPTPILEHFAPVQGTAEAKALTGLYKKINEEGQRLNTTATIAEFLSVVRQFGKPMDAIVDLSNRRLNRLELARKGLSGSTTFKKQKWAEIVASTYLEYSFGLAPLISDVRGIAEAFARWKYEQTGEQRFRARLVSRAEDENARVYDNPAVLDGIPNSWFVWEKSHKVSTKVRVQYSVGMRSNIYADFGSNDRLLELLGFTPRNWIPGLYEAIPWSWLLDYFTNMQDILEAGVTSTAGVTWISKTVSTVTEHQVKHFVRGDATVARISSFGWTGRGTGTGGSYTVRRTTMQRTTPDSLGIPPLIYEHPFDSWKKSLNLAAVLMSRRASSSALWLF